MRQVARVSVSVVLFAVLSHGAYGQDAHRSASDVIKLLTFQTERPGADPARRFLFSCGEDYADRLENRALARELVDLGASSLPDLEAAFESIERFGIYSPFADNAGLLFDAYAKITGPAWAFSRLRKMIGIPQLAALQGGLDVSIALSLGLTSYVSGSRGIIGEPIFSCAPEEPRDALDRLALAWELGDRRAFEEKLGPHAKAAAPVAA